MNQVAQPRRSNPVFTAELDCFAFARTVELTPSLRGAVATEKHVVHPRQQTKERGRSRAVAFNGMPMSRQCGCGTMRI